jgi:hypothetical protein
MFRIGKKKIEIKPILGMCHNCFKSNVEMSNIKKILCVDCVPSIN